jgi:hypothetical protein
MSTPGAAKKALCWLAFAQEDQEHRVSDITSKAKAVGSSVVEELQH